MTTCNLIHGDCLTLLKTLPDASIDAVVTDPPYGLKLLGKAWDYDVPEVAVWAECLRVLKPGGYLLSFAGTRTQHRMAVRIEDAGFEIRDMLAWLYGSGFPKSFSVSAQLDKRRHERDDVLKVTAWVRSARDAAGLKNADLDAAFGFAGMSGHWTSAKSQPTVPTLEQVPVLLRVLGVKEEDVPADVRRLLVELNGRKGTPGEAWLRAEVVGEHEQDAAVNRWRGDYTEQSGEGSGDRKIRAPSSPEAKKWAGWGTALKPALEPLTMARKPFSGTLANNLSAGGVGALNIDACRVGDRFPANVLHDGDEEVLDLFPGQGDKSAALPDGGHSSLSQQLALLACHARAGAVACVASSLCDRRGGCL